MELLPPFRFLVFMNGSRPPVGSSVLTTLAYILPGTTSIFIYSSEREEVHYGVHHGRGPTHRLFRTCKSLHRPWQRQLHASDIPCRGARSSLFNQAVMA